MRCPASLLPLCAVAIVFASGLFIANAHAQPLTLTHRNGITLGSTTTDQNGVSFTVTGISGITHCPTSAPNHYWSIRDNSNKLVKLSISLSTNATITAASYLGGFSFAESRDFEDLSFMDSAQQKIAICEEGTPAVRVYSLTNGALLNTLTTPAVFTSRRSNFGFESLTSSPAPFDRDGEIWTANEEALSVDGPVSTPSNGTIVRLLRYTVSNGVVTPAQQYAYLTQPMHGGAITGGRSGVSALCRLPNGKLLLLERSLAASLTPYQARIYELDFASATNVAAISSLVGATYTPVGKRLLYSGNLTKIEGLCLGPKLANGNYAILGIIDDDDPISDNRIESFELSGTADPCPADLDNGEGLGLPDRAVDINDLLFFLNKFEAGHPRANLDDGSGMGVPDAGVDISDLLYLLSRFEGGC